LKPIQTPQIARSSLIHDNRNEIYNQDDSQTPKYRIRTAVIPRIHRVSLPELPS